MTTRNLKRWMKATYDKDYKWNQSVCSLLQSEDVTVPQRECMFAGIWERSLAGSRWGIFSPLPLCPVVCCVLLSPESLIDEWTASRLAGEKPGLPVSWIPLSWLLSITQTVWNKELWHLNRLFVRDFFYCPWNWKAVDAGAWRFLLLTSCVKYNYNTMWQSWCVCVYPRCHWRKVCCSRNGLFCTFLATHQWSNVSWSVTGKKKIKHA